jgi:AraC-like DNA-binding protein
MVENMGFSAIFAHMDDWLHLPRQAIDAFEHGSKLHVSIHDFTGQLLPCLPSERFLHSSPACQAVKLGHQDRCMGFCADRTRRELASQPQGRVQCCHAGWVEWVLPVLHEGRLEAVLFAGQRRPGRNLAVAVRDNTPATRIPWATNRALPAPVDDGEALLILEMLRQLGARLRDWREDFRCAAMPQPSAATRLSGQTTRSALIRRFMHQRHTQPVRLADLAEMLHVSESRAGHVTRQACGKSFIELLTEARLATAAGLLRHTNLSVQEIAARSGFGDLSHFHHAFRKHHHTTPHKFRRAADETNTCGARV